MTNRREFALVVIAFAIFTLLTIQLIVSQLNDIRTSIEIIPKIVRDGNLDMFKSTIIINTIFFTSIMFIGSVILLYIMKHIIKSDISMKIIFFILLVSLYLGSLIVVSLKENNLKGSDSYNSIITKSESFIEDITSGNFKNAYKNYNNSVYLNSFISASLYKGATKKVQKGLGQITKIEQVITKEIDNFSIVICPAVYDDTHKVYFALAFNDKQELSGFYLSSAYDME